MEQQLSGPNLINLIGTVEGLFRNLEMKFEECIDTSLMMEK